jgi:predicted AlkP superfamily phosphohydrolase/phosphomutase
MEQGKLPTFQYLAKNGASGILKSTIPPVTPAAWTTFATGLHPRKTGIFDFFYQDENYEYNLVNATHLKSRTMWDILSFYQKKSIVVNVPMTYPPKQINGVIVPGMFTPRHRFTTYPDSIKQELQQMVPHYVVEASVSKLQGLSDEGILHEIMNMTKQRRNAFWYLLDKPWDLFTMVFRGSDILQHLLWSRKDLLLKYYQYIDSFLSEVIDKMDKDTSLMIVSDHGFQKLEKIFHLNQWLAQKGFLKRKRGNRLSDSKYLSLSNTRQTGKRSVFLSLLQGFGITKERIRSQLSQRQLAWVQRNLPMKLKRALPDTDLDIDWQKTQAYVFSITSGGIRLNVKGRDRRGMIDPEDYEAVRSSIIRELQKIKEPSGKQLFPNILTKEEVCGTFLHQHIPDIFIQSPGTSLDTKFSNGILKYSNHYGAHHEDGIFMGYGPGFIKGKRVNAHLVDIAPTVLSLLDVSIPEVMDGSNIQEARS